MPGPATKTSVIVPVFNEERTLEAVIDRIRDYLASEQPASVRRKRFRREDWQKRPAA